MGGNKRRYANAGTVIGGLILGIFGDALGKGAGRAWAWIAAVLVVIISAVLTAFTRSLGRLQILRALMGIGTDGMEPVNVAMVGEWLARRRNLEKVNDWILEHGMTPSVDLDQEPRRTKSIGLSATLKSARVVLANRNALMAVVLSFMFLYTETSIISFLRLQLTRDVRIALASAAVIAGASGITGCASGLIAAPLAGVIVEHFGFTWHYLILSAICLLALVPISLIQEEKRDAGAAGVRQA